MNKKMIIGLLFVSAGFALIAAQADPKGETSQPKQTERSFDAPHGMKLTVRMIGPYAAKTDLQIICAFKHKAAGDTYIGAMNDFDDKVEHLLSNVRNRGEFVGELGETFLFKTWKDSITPKRILVIGLGAENDLSLDSLRLVGRVAAREAVRLKAADVAFAPVIRDQGNNTLDVGAGDAAFVEAMLLAYDTEMRLQKQGINGRFEIREWVIEAGPAYVDGAIERVGRAIEAANAAILKRESAGYRAPMKK